MEKNAFKSLSNLEHLVNQAPLSRAERESLADDIQTIERVMNEFIKVQQRAEELKKKLQQPKENKE